MVGLAQERLLEKGIRPSVQRLSVYQYLLDNPTHPTVDTVFTALAPAIPTLSKTTVYNTLKLLVENNLVQTITIEDDELRYDANMEDHIHFKCEKCGAIRDFFSPIAQNTTELIKKQLPSGFSPRKIHISVWGICNKCNN
jgi:Fe2+ or Zn2+ uptake regulation protein